MPLKLTNLTNESTSTPAIPDNYTIPPIDSQVVAGYIGYITVGTLVILGNSLILIAMIRNPSLRRKEFIIPAALALSDGLYGFGYLSAGARRLYLLLNYMQNDLVTPWYCMWTIHNSFFVFAGQAMTLTLSLMAIDRFIAMSSPALYWNLTERYAVIMCVCAYLYAAVSWVVCIVASYRMPDAANVKLTCISYDMAEQWYIAYDTFHKPFFGLLSAVIYVFAIVFMSIGGRKIEHDAIKKEYFKRQVKVTKLLLWIMVVSVFALDIPMFLTFYASVSDYQIPSKIAPFLWQLILWNSASNIVVYLLKNEEIRKAVFELFGVKGSNVVASMGVSKKRDKQGNTNV